MQIFQRTECFLAHWSQTFRRQIFCCSAVLDREVQSFCTFDDLFKVYIVWLFWLHQKASFLQQPAKVSAVPTSKFFKNFLVIVRLCFRPSLLLARKMHLGNWNRFLPFSYKLVVFNAISNDVREKLWPFVPYIDRDIVDICQFNVQQRVYVGKVRVCVVFLWVQNNSSST